MSTTPAATPFQGSSADTYFHEQQHGRRIVSAVESGASTSNMESISQPRRPPTPDMCLDQGASDPVYAQDKPTLFTHSPYQATSVDDAPERPRARPSRTHHFIKSETIQDGPVSTPGGSDRSSSGILNAKEPLERLIKDPSMYANPLIKPERTTLAELARIVRLSRYHERKCASMRLRLQRSIVSMALTIRFTRCADMAQSDLADSFRNSDKRAFALLYKAIEDVQMSCSEWKRFALLEPDLDQESPQAHGLALDGEVSTDPKMTRSSVFFADLSLPSRHAFLGFLTKIRTDARFLASRLTAMSSAERAALVAPHSSSHPIESVLPGLSKYSGRVASPFRRNGISSGSSVERLLYFQRRDPLSALVHTCFADSMDSHAVEDQRRLNLWADTCAHLISSSQTESRTGHESVEPLLIAVLSIWTRMRGWAGRSKMEWYLMNILEKGAFLLDRAEDQHGTRFNVSAWTSKDQVKAEKFYERAVEELFDTINDEDGGGIPDGLLELGNEILRRLHHNHADYIRRWIIYKWLFSVWLLGVIVHPEGHGLMLDYYITDYGRQRILKHVAMKASMYVSDMLATWTKQDKPTPPSKIQAHISQILRRFQARPTKSKHRLLPAKSVTSLHDTIDVQPYLVISSADLLTLVNALYPERRPISSQSSQTCSSSPPISGLSVGIQTHSNSSQPGVDIITMTGSERSDSGTSTESLTNRSPPQVSPSNHRSPNHGQLADDDQDGYRLRLAVYELSQTLGPDAMRAKSHPCAERWEVLYISPDGKDLSTQSAFDHDDELEEPQSSSSSSEVDDDEAQSSRPDLDGDYHQLRDTILKLVENFEIPDPDINELEDNLDRSLRVSSPLGGATNDSNIPSLNRNPGVDDINALAGRRNASGDEPTATGVAPALVRMLTAAASQAREQSDFISAHQYWVTLKQLQRSTSKSLRGDGYAALINIFSRGPRDSIRRANSAAAAFETWQVWLKQSHDRADHEMRLQMRHIRSLRDKMWYVTDVRNSQPYEQSRNIVQALKSMGSIRADGSAHRQRGQALRSANVAYRSDSQILELISAIPEQGGPNKLSDDQTEKTIRWLHNRGIENMCQGEERLHRFCCEIDDCLNKLTGENIMDSPVLWSSELFASEKLRLESGPNRRGSHSSHWYGDDASSVSSEAERRYSQTTGRPSSMARDGRPMSSYNLAQAGLDASRFGGSRPSSIVSDVLEGADHLGFSSPVHTADSASTFWSPFQSSMSGYSGQSFSQSAASSVTSLHASFPPNTGAIGRPQTAGSSSETLLLQRGNDKKALFLRKLRQFLIGLLLSDLGQMLYPKGSETDAWFQVLGQDCIARQDAAERKIKLKASNAPSAKKATRALNKRKSFENLRDARPSSTDPSNLKDVGTPIGGNSNHNAREVDGMSTIEGNKTAHQLDEAPSDLMPDFPFSKAYRRLIKMFDTHPNPFAKLDALLELENLIVASLTVRKPRHWSAFFARPNNQAENGDARPSYLFAGAMNSLKERRGSASQHPVLSRGSMPRSDVDDPVTMVLQDLFRDASIRPRTLFRDLQFIASFVPSEILDRTAKGKAFWNASLAALGLKQDVCVTMVEVADSVVQAYTKTPRMPGLGTETNSSNDSGHDDRPSQDVAGQQYAPAPPATPPPPTVAYKLQDAGRMLAITAKEGHPTSQRELALLYLSNPELVDRVVLPLSKPREVFKPANHNSSRHGPSYQDRGSGSGRSGLHGAGHGTTGAGDVRTDTALMRVAIHWMEAAQRGGDDLAKTFVKQMETADLS